MGAVSRGDADVLADILIIENRSATAFLWSEPVMCASVDVLTMKAIGHTHAGSTV